MTTTVIFLTVGTVSWVVPADWNNSSNTIGTIGGGGGGGGSNISNLAGAGGGGAYSEIANLFLTPGASVTVNIGTGGIAGSNSSSGSAGGDTWFNGASLAASSVGSKGGGGGPGSGGTGGTGGAAASGIGTTKFSGGNGGTVTTFGGPGGGGAAGPNGDGKNGGNVGSSNTGGSGGGAGSGGSIGSSPSGDSGADGGAGFDSTVGGTGGTSSGQAGGVGSHGSGGGGGRGQSSAGSTGAGGQGGAGIEFDTSHGAGGGGGGGGAGLSGIPASNGGAGGSYGGGGGAGAISSGNNTTGGIGADGLIIIIYSPPIISLDARITATATTRGEFSIPIGLVGGIKASSSVGSSLSTLLSLSQIISSKSSIISSASFITSLSARIGSLSSSRTPFNPFQLLLHGRIGEQSSLRAIPLDGTTIARGLTRIDPLWIALEIDTVGQVTQEPYTIRLGNRGSLQRTVLGTRYQYAPRLITDIVIGTAISIAVDAGSSSTPFYQQPLRGQPTGGEISWIIDPDSEEWHGPSSTVIVGKTFRLYWGRTFDPDNADVDTDLTLVYTGHVVDFTFDVTAKPPIAKIRTTDASSTLDKSLVTDLYPSDFPIAALQGKPKPELHGRKLSIQPVLEDQASLTYRVTRIEIGYVELDDIMQLTVGGVPWRRVTSLFTVDLTSSLSNLLAQYAALPGPLQADYNSVVGGDPANFNNSTGLQNKVNLVATLTLYNGLTGPQQLDYNLTIAANPAFYNNTPAGILNKMGLIKSRFYGLQQGEWMADLGNGTVQLGSDPAGADVRVDAQTTDWTTLTTAAFITKICTKKGVSVNTAYMTQLNLDWSGLVGFWTDTNDINCLDLLDKVTSSELCWWAFDAAAAVIAGIFDIPNPIPDYFFIGFTSQVPLDSNLLLPTGFTAIDPVPREIDAISQQGIIPPASRVRIGYAGRASPQSSFLPGATQQEQADLSAVELVADWPPGFSGYQLSPSDGAAILSINPRAQDVYISSLSNTYAEANALRTRLVQRVIGNIDHQLLAINVRMDPTDVKLMASVQFLWVDENNKNRIIYGGSGRATSAIMAFGVGPQQLPQQLITWSVFGVSSDQRTSSTSAPPVAIATTPISITIVPFRVLSDAVTGDIIAALYVATNNGSPFAGFFNFTAPYINDGGTVEIIGNSVNGFNLVLNRDLSGGDIGVHNTTITATQGGVTISQNYSFTVSLS